MKWLRTILVVLVLAVIPSGNAWMSLEAAKASIFYGAETWMVAVLALLPAVATSWLLAKVSPVLVALLMFQVVAMLGLNDFLYDLGCVLPYDRQFHVPEDWSCDVDTARGIGNAWVAILALSVSMALLLARPAPMADASSPSRRASRP